VKKIIIVLVLISLLTYPALAAECCPDLDSCPEHTPGQDFGGHVSGMTECAGQDFGDMVSDMAVPGR